MTELLRDFVTDHGDTAVGLLLVLLVALLVHVVARRRIVRLVEWVVSRTRTRRDEVFVEHQVPQRLSLLLPLLVIHLGSALVPGLGAGLLGFLQRLASALMILIVVWTADGILSALHRIYRETPGAAQRPITTWVQLGKVLLYGAAAILAVAQLSGQSPWYFVSGLGAMMAVLLLIFRDTLLSLVASVKLTSNDLIRVGDWIEMPQFDADGDVTEISLSTVSVQNWDKTITVIPTHKFLDHSFRNWRGMQESGGRRIKRAIHVNTATVRFLTEAEVEEFSRMELLADYIRGKLADIAAAESADPPRNALERNQRRLTNLGTLRAWIIAYLRVHPHVHPDMTLLVRQLAPTPEGVPIEIYCFTDDIAWATYEAIQADIFDHVLAMVPRFGLAVYQRPSGQDLDSALRETA
jgi:miniconductance mechanosensitive channel